MSKDINVKDIQLMIKALEHYRNSLPYSAIKARSRSGRLQYLYEKTLKEWMNI